jgi:catechol 2,3-dioxygenase-like lactoylglutathione lyase family enzyme
MRVERVSFVAVRTANSTGLVEFFRDLLGMRVFVEAAALVALRMSSGDVVEVFPVDDDQHGHFGTAPVVGFEVDDLEAAYACVEAARDVEILSPIQRGSMGSSWFHLRGPDGNVYELLTSVGPEQPQDAGRQQ